MTPAQEFGGNVRFSSPEMPFTARCFVIAPSKEQPYHEFHTKNCIATFRGPDRAAVCLFEDGRKVEIIGRFFLEPARYPFTVGHGIEFAINKDDE
jgi:hypothetical protein